MHETEMTIDSIRVSLMNYQRALILKEKETERYLPIWIGVAEADAIAVKLQGVHSPRPLTHDFICTIIEALGAAVKSVVINKLQDDTFFAKVTLVTDNHEIELDCRPSDAVAVAVRVEVPIFADKEVLDKAGVDTAPEK
ncbi:bifunctional nuclease family protein [Chloroflexota bacterium]